MRMRSLAIVNQKGGAGKSTLTTHLAYAAVEAGLRVLLVDMDRQRNLSLGFTKRPANAEPVDLTSLELFSAEAPVLEPEDLGNGLGLIAGVKALERLTSATDDVVRRPRRHLEAFAHRFDLALIDCPGSIGWNPPMTLGALVAADAVVCPFSVGQYEAEALSDLWAYLQSIKSGGYNPQLRLLGLVASRINAKSPLEVEGLAGVRKSLGTHVLPGQLNERAAVKQAIALRRPVWRGTKGKGHMDAAKEWREMCHSILGQLGGVRK